MSDWAPGALTATDYTGNQYYEKHKKGGLDYLSHGYWQKSYAAMVTDAAMQTQFPLPFFFDAGCACGSPQCVGGRMVVSSRRTSAGAPGASGG